MLKRLLSLLCAITIIAALLPNMPVQASGPKPARAAGDMSRLKPVSPKGFQLKPKGSSPDLQQYSAKGSSPEDYLKSGYWDYGWEVPSDNAEITAVVKEIVAGKNTPLERASAVYLWVVENIRYDYTYQIYEAMDTFDNRKGVCNGFALLVTAMMRAAGIPAKYVMGAADGGGGWPDKGSLNHAWNELYIDGQWYSADATWDSCYFDSYRIWNGPDYSIADYRTSFYMVPEKAFSSDHRKLYTNLDYDYEYQGGEVRVTLASFENKAKLYYTLDGTEPSINSALYSGPFTVTEGMILKAVSIVPQGTSGYMEIPFFTPPQEEEYQLYGITANQDFYFNENETIALSGHVLSARRIQARLVPAFRFDSYSGSVLEGKSIDLSQLKVQVNPPLTAGTYPFELHIYKDDNWDKIGVIPVSVHVSATGIVHAVPADGVMDFPRDRELVFTFNTALAEGEAYGGIRLTDASGAEVAVDKSIRSNQLVLKPLEPLQGRAVFHVYIPAHAVNGMDGTPLGYEKRIDFSTNELVDDSSPEIVSVDPADQTAGLASNQPITIEWSEPVNRGTGSITVTGSRGSIPFRETHQSNRLMITPADETKGWGYNEKLTLTVEAGAVSDLAGNANSSAAKYTFKTKGVKEIRSDTGDILLSKGESRALPAVTVVLEDGTDLDVTKVSQWSVTSVKGGPSGVALIEDGAVKAQAYGTAKLTAEYGGKKIAFTVNVVAPVASLTAAEPELSMEPGQDRTVAVEALYDDGTTKDVTAEAEWSSSRPEVAAVEKGKVSAIGKGSAEITAEYGGKSIRIPVTVASALEKLKSDNTRLQLDLGKSAELPAVRAIYKDGTKEDVPAAQVAWKSENPGVAAVDEQGTVRGLSKGKTVIVGEYQSKTISFIVEVVPVLTGIGIARESYTVEAGKTISVKALAVYNDGSLKNITSSALWRSNEASVATVVKGGSIKGLAEGKAVITASYGGISASITVLVTPASSKLQMSSGGKGKLKSLIHYTEPFLRSAFRRPG